MKRILVISHEGSRSGAPIELMYILNWLKHNTNVSFDLVQRVSGELDAELSKYAKKVFVCSRKNILQFFVNLLRLRFRRYDLIYSNTVINGRILNFIKSCAPIAICHAHEMGEAIQETSKAFSLTKKICRYFIAVSEAVRVDLIDKHNIPEESVIKIYGGVPITECLDRTLYRRKIREEFNLPEDAYIVIGSGRQSWTKGTDLFLAMAESYLKRCEGPKPFFLWMGADPTPKERVRIDLKIKPEFREHIRFIGVKIRPLEYFAGSDIFALTSREDSIPLVMLEAGLMRCPVICFEGTGGSTEFTALGGGIAAPYLDFDAMADGIFHLIQDAERQDSICKRARELVIAQYDVNNTAAKIWEFLQRVKK